MPLYVGGQRIEKLYKGATPIARAYKGSTLVFAAQAVVIPFNLVADPSDLTTYNFTSPIPAEHAAMRVVGVIHTGFGSASAGNAIDAATIGGSAASIHGQVTGSTRHVAIISRKVAANASTAVSITMTHATLRAACKFYGVIGGKESGSPSILTDDTAPLSGTVAVPKNGYVIAGSTVQPDAGGFTWTGIGEEYDEEFEVSTTRISGGFAHKLAANASYSVVADNGTPTNPRLIALAWD